MLAVEEEPLVRGEFKPADAEALVRQDPLILNECVDWELNGWIADVGDIELTDGGAWYGKAEGERSGKTHA